MICITLQWYPTSLMVRLELIDAVLCTETLPSSELHLSVSETDESDDDDVDSYVLGPVIKLLSEQEMVRGSKNTLRKTKKNQTKHTSPDIEANYLEISGTCPRKHRSKKETTSTGKTVAATSGASRK